MTHGLSAIELAQIRSDCGELLPDTGYILSLTRTSDGAGGWTETWGTATGGTVSCRMDFAKPYGHESVANASLTPFKSGVLSLPYDTTITEANRFELNSSVYSVTAVNNNQSWMGIKRASVERVP